MLFKKFFRYVSFSVIGMLALSCYILVDTYFIAQAVGLNGLAALNLAIPIYNLINGSALMIGMGGSTLFTIAKAKNDNYTSNNIFSMSLYIYLIISSIFVILGTFFVKDIATILGANENTFKLAEIYIKCILLFAPAFLLNQLMICFVRNDNNPKLAMIAMVCGSVSNIILDYIFMFYFNLGMFGAVLATCLAPIFGLSVTSTHIIFKKNNFKFTKFNFNIKNIFSILSTGVPSLIGELASGVVIIIFNLLILKISGNVGVAAFGIITNLALVLIAIYTGLAQGTQPLISLNYGCKNIKNIKKILKYSLITMSIISIIVYIFLFFYTDVAISIFNKDNDAILNKISNTGIKLYFTAAPFIGFNIILINLFASIEITRASQSLSLLRSFIIIIPTVYLMTYLFKLNGLWLSILISEFIVCIIGVIIYKKVKLNIKIK